MNRLPELHADLADPSMVPDAAQAEELEDLALFWKASKVFGEDVLTF